jgi:predicted Na+-dependent transporter
MSSLVELLPVVLKTCVSVLIFAIGLGSTLGDLTYLWRRPGLLLRSLLAMYVLVPCAAFAVASLLPLSPGVKAGLLVLAVSAGAPLLPRKLSKFGGGSYTFSLVVISSALAIFLVPAWVALLARHFAVDTDVPPSAVAAVIGKAFLLPLLAGMALRLVVGEAGERLSDRLMVLAGGVLTLLAIALLVTQWELLLRVARLPGMVALLALMAAALAIGHWLGGPTEDDRTTLAVACATRHIGVAVLVASAFPGTRTVAMIAAYSLASALASIPYLRWRRRRSRSGTAEAAP